MTVSQAGAEIERAVASWPGVSAHPHRFGGLEYLLGKREIGHGHGDHLVDIPFPTALGKRLIAEGRAQVHQFLPDSGWVSVPLHTPADMENALALLKKNYEIANAPCSPGSAEGTWSIGKRST